MGLLKLTNKIEEDIGSLFMIFMLMVKKYLEKNLRKVLFVTY